MASLPLRRCNAPGCGVLVRASRCDRHKREQKKQLEENRPNAHERGYNQRWRTERKYYLAMHPICVECEKNGRIKAASVVDHIVPHRGDYKRFWDRRNWQPLCKRCHDSKTARGE